MHSTYGDTEFQTNVGRITLFSILVKTLKIVSSFEGDGILRSLVTEKIGFKIGFPDTWKTRASSSQFQGDR